MKNKEKHEFRSSAVLSLLGLVALSAILIAAPWNRQMKDTGVQIALQKAEIVGYQVVQIYREAIKVSLSSNKAAESSGRQPASIPTEGLHKNLRSVGTLGVDPWGQPYHYRILPSERAGFVRILVWSSGPNRKIESPELGIEDVAMIGHPTYAGDDIGVVLSMSQN